MARETIQFSFRLDKGLHDRLISVVAATENEVTRSGLCELALESFLAQLAVNPAMVTNYDPARDKYARQKARRQANHARRKTEKDAT